MYPPTHEAVQQVVADARKKHRSCIDALCTKFPDHVVITDDLIVVVCLFGLFSFRTRK